MAKKKARDPDAPELIVSKHYNDDIVISFDPIAKRNRYVITDCGEILKPSPPSVTTLTGLADFGKSSSLQAWAVNKCLEIVRERVKPDEIHGAQFLEEAFADAQANYRNVTKEAADVGTMAHAALERYFTDPEAPPPIANTPVRARFDEALKWFAAHNIEHICSEKAIYSRKYKYTGRLDHVSKVDKVLSLLDFKASRHVYKTYAMQIAAYAHAYEEETGQRIEQAYILQIGENETTPYFFDRSKLDVGFKGFLGLLDVYNCDKMLGTLKPEEKDWLLD